VLFFPAHKFLYGLEKKEGGLKLKVYSASEVLSCFEDSFSKFFFSICFHLDGDSSGGIENYYLCHFFTDSIIAYNLYFVNTYSLRISLKFSKTPSGIGTFLIGLFPGYFQAEIIIIFFPFSFCFFIWYINQIS